MIVVLDAVFVSKMAWATDDTDSTTVLILLLPWRIVRIIFSTYKHLLRIMFKYSNQLPIYCKI